MFTLFLDTASAEHILALCTERGTLVSRRSARLGESELIQTVEEALLEAHRTYKDLTHIACAIGPGGFTSLRVGVACINALSYALELPSAGVHLSELWNARMRSIQNSHSNPNPHFLWLHSTRKTHLFVKGFGRFEEKYPAPTLLSLEQASTLEGPYVGELIEEHRTALLGCQRIPDDQLLALEEVLPVFLERAQYERRQLLPWYGRGS